MTVPPESAVWMEGVDSKDSSKDGAISVPEPSLSPSGLRPSSRSHRFALRSTIAAHPECFAILAIALIWAVTFYAMGVI